MLRNYNIFCYMIALCAALPLQAQLCEEATATAFMSANRLEVAIRNGGDLFTDGQSAQFLTPLKDNDNLQRAGIYAAGLWMGGYDAGGDLHLAAQTYRQSGNDYWAGPINAQTLSTDSLTCSRLDQVWKVELLDVLQVIQDYQSDLLVNEPVPMALLLWPGRNNPYYSTQLGFSLPNQELAPFYDRNNDGIYNPYDGDYPVYEDNNPNALADELLWTVFNDIGGIHEVSDTLALGIEVQLTAYAFNCGSDLLKDAIFTRHRIINRSGQDYYNFRAGLHLDFDLGCAADDYVGTDPTLNTLYVYNADYTDQSSACTGANYGQQPPVLSATFLNQELKKSIFNLASTVSPMGHPRDPQPAVDYYNLLSGNWVDGYPLTYGGSGYDTSSTASTDFVFPNYPFDTLSTKWWADAGFSWAQGQDFRMIGALWGDTLVAGEQRDIDMVYVYHYDPNLTGLYNMLQMIPQRIPQIQQWYNNGLHEPSCFSLVDFDAELEGYLYWDKNENCVFDLSDQPMSNVVIEARQLSTDSIYYSTTDTAGYYSFNALSFDQYEIRAILPSPYWKDACEPGGIHDVLLSHPNQLEVVNIALQEDIACPFLELDISTPVLQQCASNLYSISYCNNGTDTAYQAAVEFELDPDLTLDSTLMIPVTALGGQRYRVEVGDLPPRACGSFDFQAFLSCDSSIVGQTHCVEARIEPDSLCINLWNGPIFEVQATCLGDSIQFAIINVGTTLGSPIRTSFIVIEDDLMLPPIDVDIVGGQTTVLTVPITLGATYRGTLMQPAGISGLLSDPFATAVVEGCGVDSLGQIQLGYVNQFSNGYTSPFRAIDCQESVDTAAIHQLRAMPFVQKQAFPKGYAAAHYINNYDVIDYHVRVQNLGLAELVIRDTLSPHLDIASFEPGASSHPYRWRIYDQGIVEFSFDRITQNPMVLDDVYVKYRIAQKPFNPVGTLIQSPAIVELDTQSIESNLVYHEIGDDFINLLSYQSIDAEFERALDLSIQPHPIKDHAVLSLEVEGKIQDVQLRLYNSMGQFLQLQDFGADGLLLFERGALASGIYFFQVLRNGAILGTGQLILR